ncbi:hypothetical protein [Lentzea sp. NPDC059081]|uniref:hypothetical protein n=1 Tax=Lentzea sp. NPDC059081 TaxID=3346719 RepID=UPI0036C0A830
MSLHAFVDESRRNNTYLLAVALVSPGELARFRKFLRCMLMPGQHELHCKKETSSRRRLIASRLVAERVSVRLYTRRCDLGDEAARQRCLESLVADLLKVGAHRLVLDSRDQRDRLDARTIHAALGPGAPSFHLVYEHRRSSSEELLWIADVVAWCYGSGGEWRERVLPVVESIVDLDCPR